MKLLSLFDGAGTVPFAATLCGVTPVAASEIEPFPVAVTAKRFPHMKQLGDITKINGREIEPVDIISFGSPCQGLSVAGKGAGLADERSGLFMEAVRIIKEMREVTNGYPTIALWENVPGAFSSNGGQDFRAVLEELCKIKDGNAVIVRPAKWADAGEIMGNGYSVAWRVLDAQFWGVPQRRRRIYLVADFGGNRAGQILFERNSLQRDFAEGGKARKGTARNSAGRAVTAINGQVAVTLDANYYRGTGARGGVEREVISVENHGNDGRVGIIESGVTQTLSRRMGTGGNNAPLCIVGADCYNGDVSDKAMTVTGAAADPHHVPCVIVNDQGGSHVEKEQMCYAVQGNIVNRGENSGANGKGVKDGAMYTLTAADKHCIALDHAACLPGSRKTVRRLTPKECGRLQGMPDWWCEDIPHSDSAEYKMWGNGMALPCVLFVMENIVRVIGE